MKMSCWNLYVDEIVDVIDTEAEEDLLKLSGIGVQSFYDAVISVTRARFTWLMFNLIAAFIVSIVIKNFEGTIQKLALLAALMPIVASMGGCSGTQFINYGSTCNFYETINNVKRIKINWKGNNCRFS